MGVKFLHKQVVDHFASTAGTYVARSGMVHPKHDPVMVDFIRHSCCTESKILEVGGGSGYFLNLVAVSTPVRYLYNCELCPDIYRNQVSDDICLIGGSALALPFKEDTFDYVVIKNVLHHLVGRSRSESKENAVSCLNELFRVTKNEGFIMVLEQYNNHRVFASIVFYVTLFISVFRLSFKPLGLNRSVVVSFLTPREIRDMVQNSPPPVHIVLSDASRLKVSRRLKCTVLMSDIGRLLLHGKVKKVSKEQR